MVCSKYLKSRLLEMDSTRHARFAANRPKATRSSAMKFILWLIGLTLATLFGSPTTTEMVEHIARPPTAVYSCDSITAKREGDVHRIDVKVTATNGATIRGYVFDFGDDSGLIATRSPYILATFGQVGMREVRVMVLFDIGGYTTEVDTCRTTIYPPGA